MNVNIVRWMAMGLCCSAAAEPLVEYQFENKTLAPHSASSGITATPLEITGTISQSAGRQPQVANGRITLKAADMDTAVLNDDPHGFRFVLKPSDPTQGIEVDDVTLNIARCAGGTWRAMVFADAGQGEVWLNSSAVVIQSEGEFRFASEKPVSSEKGQEVSIRVDFCNARPEGANYGLFLDSISVGGTVGAVAGAVQIPKTAQNVAVAAPDAPNVLFLIADDLATRLGCYGDKAAITPQLDRLASEGVLFERAYAAGTVCTPSRKSFITGLNVKTIGWGNNNFLKDNPDAMTMPRWFREHGYLTAKVGKVQHKDEYEGPKDWDFNLNETEKFPAGNEGKVRNFLESEDGKRLMIADVRRDDQHSIDQGRTEAFERFIENKWDRSKPFFFALGFHSTHQPNEANKRYYEMHSLAKMPLTVAPAGATPMTKPFPEDFKWWSKQFSEDQQRQAIQAYYAAVTMLDDLVGQAVRFLEEQGVADHTIIVFTADQGYNLGYRDVWAKHILYPSVLRVPLIVRYPDMKNRGVRAEGLVELLDIFPTLTDLAGLSTPDGLDGESFVPLMEYPAKAGKPAAYAQGILHNGSGIAVTTKDSTYLEWDNGAFREFYDLSKDPDAWFNRVDNPEFRREVETHQNLLHQYFE